MLYSVLVNRIESSKQFHYRRTEEYGLDQIVYNLIEARRVFLFEQARKVPDEDNGLGSSGIK